jgi:hypothetical protein
MGGDVTQMKFIEKGGDKVTSWKATFNLWIKRESGYCNLQAFMPEYDFDTQKVIIPVCPPGTFVNSDESFSVEVPSGETVTSDDVVNSINGVPQVAVPSNIGADYPFVCPDANVSFQGGSIVPVPSAGSLDIQVVDGEDAIVGTLITDTDSYFWTSTTHGDFKDTAIYLCIGKAYSTTDDADGYYDWHGAGAQRSDPKTGEPEDYDMSSVNATDLVRIDNYVLLVRDVDSE